MDLAIFGVQGSGKGTQAKILSEKYNLLIFGAGDRLRELSKGDSDLSKSIAETISHGDLVRPEIILEELDKFLASIPHTQGVLYDGIPRSLHQYELFRAVLNKHHRQCWALHILLSEKAAIDRLTKRVRTEHRADDNPEAIAKRIDIFYNTTMPVIDRFREDNLLIEVDGDQTIEKVDNDIIAAIEKIVV